MSIQHDIAALEKALEAGPTPGPWRAFEHSWSDTSVLADGFDHGICMLDINHATEESQEADGMLMAANADYIAACSPDRIRRLLDALKDLQTNGPVMLRGSRGDGSEWHGTMSEVLDDQIAAAQAEAQLGDEARAKLSKALELLKEARAEMFTSNPSITVAENVDAFLKEVQG